MYDTYIDNLEEFNKSQNKIERLEILSGYKIDELTRLFLDKKVIVKRKTNVE